MRQIRRCVFETNSSSTHSISICRSREPERSDIPANSVLEITGDKAYDRDVYDEVGKLNYIVAMLSSIEESKDYGDELTYDRDSFSEFISQPRFRWLAEVVKDERNTDLKYIQEIGYRDKLVEFPYYETTSDECESIEDILSEDGKYNLDNEEKFKIRCREIIFDKEICIEDKENEQ